MFQELCSLSVRIVGSIPPLHDIIIGSLARDQHRLFEIGSLCTDNWIFREPCMSIMYRQNHERTRGFTDVVICEKTSTMKNVTRGFFLSGGGHVKYR
jgi:hypothetical protein